MFTNNFWTKAVTSFYLDEISFIWRGGVKYFLKEFFRDFICVSMCHVIHFSQSVSSVKYQ